jgi:hypothetical protein
MFVRWEPTKKPSLFSRGKQSPHGKQSPFHLFSLIQSSSSMKILTHMIEIDTYSSFHHHSVKISQLSHFKLHLQLICSLTICKELECGSESESFKHAGSENLHEDHAIIDEFLSENFYNDMKYERVFRFIYG